MTDKKNEYILKSISKIANKKWEFFVISRVIHGLDDDDIEFVTQQLVKAKDGKRYLTDLYFPQLGIHLEIDEPHHFSNQEIDKIRERDIISSTNHEIKRVLTHDDKGAELSLAKIRTSVDTFIAHVKAKKVLQGSFIPWDIESKYSADHIIERGYLRIADNVTFRLQTEALKCFGFNGKGYQKGAWTIPDKSGDWVWFPRLYLHNNWNNSLSNDGNHIYEKATNEAGKISIAKQLEDFRKNRNGNCIVFAKAKDNLGLNLLRYVGTFKVNESESNEEQIRFDKIDDKEDIRKISYDL